MQTDQTAAKIVAFVAPYLTELSRLMGEYGRDRLPFHGDITELTWTFIGKDGAATFYLPMPAERNFASGHYAHDFSGNTLNEILQTLHLHRFKIDGPHLGEPWNSFQAIPPDTLPIEGLPKSFFHDDVRSLAKSGKLRSLNGITLGRPVQIENDIRTRTIATRQKIWSPVFGFPEIGRRRLFLWSHADIWWAANELDLDPESARRIAEADALAMEILLGDGSAWTPEQAQRDADQSAADKLFQYCDEYAQLLDQYGHKEEMLHQWLSDYRHQIFLSPAASQVWSKMSFGNFVSDFVIRRPDGTYSLIEVEPATKRIFRKDNGEPTAEFNHACQQIRDWQMYIREHVHHVREIQNLEGIYDPDGLLIMGRSRDIDEPLTRGRWRDMKARRDPTVMTHDEIIDHVRSVGKNLENIFGRLK